MRQALKNKSIDAGVKTVRTLHDLEQVDGLIIPGGESTTISHILRSSGLHDVLLKRIQKQDLSILGTCAGSVLLAQEMVEPHTEVKLLGGIDMQVKRNAFGRQKESFEYDLVFNQFTSPFPAVFIRAPLITRIWGNCRPLAQIDEQIVAVTQENMMACVFHPELTQDTRIHEFFIGLIF